MKYKVLVGFSGAISASLDDEIEIINQDWAEDLLNAGYIEPVEEDAVDESMEEEPVNEPEEEPVKKVARGRGRKASEGK